ncbi:3072_t:CDS:2 [Funneliformis mosseae]|uniref:CST complex subunit CTC1 n=1 Tax=Funneliformis mosseae TaxID=27381 RepID=A0A9N9DGG7_FUNMO|nr:3072_t:CDS:2 [Funneliformis mosseae]
MTQYHRWLLSKLISNKQCITTNTVILLGNLQLVIRDNSVYPKGTILFEDETGKVPCLLIGYEKEWFTRTISLLSWSFLINKQPNGKEVFHLEVHSEVLFLQDSEALYSKATNINIERFEKRNRLSFSSQQLNPLSFKTATDMLFNFDRNSTKSPSKLNLCAMVNMKSVLYQTEGETTFIVTLNEVHDPSSFVHIVFHGDHFIEYYKMIMVGEIYFFKEATFNKKASQSIPIFEVVEVSSIDPVKNINREHEMVYNSSNLIENTQNSTDLGRMCFGYEGIITYIIDNALGLFVLDSEYILHLGKYPEYNPLITPYRLGMKLLLHNIHAIKLTMEKDTWKLNNHKNCPSFENINVIFAACHCSTIQVIRFPNEIIRSDSVSQKIISKFSSFRNSDLITLLELLWVQKAYYDISNKFPGEFEDQTLLSDPRPSKSNVEACLLSKLLRKYRVSNYFQDWAQDYFNHKNSCRITEENEEINIRLPPISEVLQFIDELVSSQRLSEFLGGDQSRVFSQLEAKLEKIHLMGFLEVNLDGTLQLKDQTGKISVVNISIEKVHTHHLNNVWIIPEYELVIEQHSKIYLRFAIEKCFCFYAKPYNSPFKYNQIFFQVRHIFSTKLNCPSEYLAPNMNCKLQIEMLDFSEDSPDLTTNSRKIAFNNISRSAFIHLSGDFIKILPAIHVGLFYELSFGKPEQIINSMGMIINFNLNNFVTANVINLQWDASNSTFEDLLGHVIQPKILELDESSKDSFRVLEKSFSIEDKLLDVQEILNEHFIGRLVSLKGLVVSKEIRSSLAQPNFMNSSTSKYINVGQLNANLLLRIQDIHTEEIIDVYINNISRYVIPIGLIPGQTITLRKVEVRKSDLGNIYCYAHEITHISLQGYPKANISFYQELNNTNLIDLFEDGISIQCTFRILCRITHIYEIILQFVCEACERIIYNNSCPNGCHLGRRFYALCKFKISDGTCFAIVTARDDIVVRELLCINDDSYRKICDKVEKSRFFYEWTISNDNDFMKKSLSDFISLKGIRRDVILFCRKLHKEKKEKIIDQTQQSSTIELNAVRIAEKLPIFEARKKLKLVEKIKSNLNDI